MQNWRLNNLPEEFRQMLQAVSAELEFIDLTLPLRKAAAAGVLTYIPDDTHWTSEGQRIVGETIHQFLLDPGSRLAKR